MSTPAVFSCVSQTTKVTHPDEPKAMKNSLYAQGEADFLNEREHYSCLQFLQT